MSKTGYQEYRRHLPVLRVPLSPIDPSESQNKFIVYNGGWYAIYYDFLGGKHLGKFIDLDSALIVNAQRLHEKTKATAYEFEPKDSSSVIAARLKIFSDILDGLCDLWYSNSKYVTRELRTIWKIDDVTDQDNVTLPPYQLKRPIKGLIQDFLDSREAGIGARLFSDHDWEGHVQRVLTLVEDTSTEADLEKLGGSKAFTLSPVHGDLNANNVFLWLEHDRHPFMIDFPTFQKSGHCLQDFALLEVVIKLTLLDRQEDSSVTDLAAFDYSPSQVGLWIEMENQLLRSEELNHEKRRSRRSKVIEWQEVGFKVNVDLCYRLVKLLRQKASEVQQQSVASRPPIPFAEEYLPALLYHTVQAIGYPSLSVFKRMLAVYSAGSIFSMIK
jgi:hypothetical protein